MAPIVVGLDIGSSAVRAVEVQAGRRSAKVRKAGRVPLPAGAVEGGQVREAAEVTKAVKRLWHEQKFSTKNVRIGVGSGSVLVRPVELDWMPAQDLRKAMRYLVADLLPVPVDEANIDHVLLEDVERDGKRMVRVLLVATARDGVDEVIRSVRAAGLRPTTADLSPLALVRAAARTQTGADSTEAVVDVGADKIAVAVHTRGLPRFVRVIPGVGGSTLTRAVGDLLGSEPDHAEELKRGASVTGSDAASLALRDAVYRLAGEVRDTLRFHRLADPDHPPQRIVLTGLGATNPGFAEVLSEATDLPTRVLAPPAPRFRRPRADGADNDLTVSFGLCLGATA